MKRIKKFGVMQTSKVVAIIYFLLSAVVMIPIGIIGSLIGDAAYPGFPSIGGIFFIFLPILYGILGFIVTAIGCLIYNLIAGWTGGIEIEVETAETTLA